MVTVVVVEIFTTDGINFSARSAKDAGMFAALEVFWILIENNISNKIFADAFGQDPEFFGFYRAMQAYQNALIGGETSMILSPDSEFFKFFGNKEN